MGAGALKVLNQGVQVLPSQCLMGTKGAVVLALTRLGSVLQRVVQPVAQTWLWMILAVAMGVTVAAPGTLAEASQVLMLALAAALGRRQERQLQQGRQRLQQPWCRLVLLPL